LTGSKEWWSGLASDPDLLSLKPLHVAGSLLILASPNKFPARELGPSVFSATRALQIHIRPLPVTDEFDEKLEPGE
jgi:hypothetical protein